MTELTIFLGLHTLRMVFLFLGHIVVTLFALRTSQCNLNAHNFHLQCFHLHGLLPPDFGHKKKTQLPCRLSSLAQNPRISQAFSAKFSCYRRRFTPVSLETRNIVFSASAPPLSFLNHGILPHSAKILPANPQISLVNPEWVVYYKKC